MASDVDICNLALAQLGDSASVQSINPPDQSFVGWIKREARIHRRRAGYGLRPLSTLPDWRSPFPERN